MKTVRKAIRSLFSYRTSMNARTAHKPGQLDVEEPYKRFATALGVGFILFFSVMRIPFAHGVGVNVPPGNELPSVEGAPVRVFVEPIYAWADFIDYPARGEGEAYIEILKNGTPPAGIVSTAQLFRKERNGEGNDEYDEADFPVHLPHFDGHPGLFFLELGAADTLTVRYRLIEHDFTTADDCVFDEHQWAWADNFGIGIHEGFYGELRIPLYGGKDCGGSSISFSEGRLNYRIVEWNPDLAIDSVTADELLCAEVSNLGTTPSASWRVEFRVDGDWIASTTTEQSMEASTYSRICTPNPLEPITPVTITAQVIHPWDSDGGEVNNTGTVDYGGFVPSPRR